MSKDSPQACVAEFVAAMVGRHMDAALQRLTEVVVVFDSNGTTTIGKEALAPPMTANWKMIADCRH